MSARFDNIQKQGDDVYRALMGNGLNHDVATWLADLHVRVRECELSLLKAGLATEQEIKDA